jgi:hypothetical protein
MRKALFIGLCHSHFSCFCPDFERWCWGGRSCTSSAPVVQRFVVRPATSLRPPLVASLAASMGDLAMVESPASEEPKSEAREAPVLVTPGANGSSQGTVGLLRDLVKHGTDIDVPRSSAPSDAALAPGSLGTIGPVVSGLHLSGSLDFPPPPIDWRQVGDEAESGCSLVATAERILHEMLASVNRNILCLIWVGQKKEKTANTPMSSFMHSHPLLHFVSAVTMLGQRRRACVVGGGDLDTGGSRRCRSRLCRGTT